MPQMSPFNWFLLNFYFTSLMILLMNIIYYTKNYSCSPQFSLKKKYIFKIKW